MPVTLGDVAKAAGVSVAAASKVLHGSGGTIRVSEPRAEFIRETAKRLRYHPNALARGLRNSKTHTVGLYFEEFGDISSGPLYMPMLIGGLGTKLFPNQYRLTLLPDLEDAEVLGSLGNGLLEGVIWCKLARNKETERQIRRCPIPIVAFNAGRPQAGSGVTTVGCDNDQGIELAVEHLWSLGHRRILYVHEWEEATVPDQITRQEAFLAAMSRRGVDATQDVAEWDWRMYAFQGWWAGRPPHTAVLAWTERAASEVLSRAAECGVRLPDQLSVVGFDSTQFCETLKPRLTAVRQPVFDMAQRAAEVLLGLIRGQQPEQLNIIFPCALDVRDSTSIPSHR